ncbi:hypothetical protein RHMOL_Rhmol13G0215600 [Rhododendron molle]|uniref:Uncharacterized protein n=1 Tax=Rhododendron molle TaxID=49168 RepID=A0ACC0LA93_RHOML|nr:hypothetical protein RHMOL_Rhmol13G0215600 [Rhododendron molle]
MALHCLWKLTLRKLSRAGLGGVTLIPFVVAFDIADFWPFAFTRITDLFNLFKLVLDSRNMTNSNFYESDSGELYQTPYSDHSYDFVPFQEPIKYSGYEFREPGFVEYNSAAYSNAHDPYLSVSEINYSAHSVTEPKLIEYNRNPYGGAYDPYFTRSEINYSTYSFSEPKLIEYNPNPYGTGYYSPETQFSAPKLIEYNPNPYGTGYYSPETQYVISYSTKSDVVDDTEYEEYDPTPYGGGYDPTLTYGRPLVPSDEICYPRSVQESNVPSFDNFFFDSIPSPYGKDNGTGPTGAIEEQEPPEKPIEPSRGEPVESYTSDNYYPWSGYGYGCGNEDYGSRNGYDRKVVPTTYDYGIDALDLCESLFGYWPCLYKNNGRNGHGDQESGSEERREENQWMSAGDCLFGSPFGNGGDETGNYGGHPHSYLEY